MAYLVFWKSFSLDLSKRWCWSIMNQMIMHRVNSVLQKYPQICKINYIISPHTLGDLNSVPFHWADGHHHWNHLLWSYYYIICCWTFKCRFIEWKMGEPVFNRLKIFYRKSRIRIPFKMICTAIIQFRIKTKIPHLTNQSCVYDVCV